MRPLLQLAHLINHAKASQVVLEHQRVVAVVEIHSRDLLPGYEVALGLVSQRSVSARVPRLKCLSLVMRVVVLVEWLLHQAVVVVVVGRLALSPQKEVAVPRVPLAQDADLAHVELVVLLLFSICNSVAHQLILHIQNILASFQAADQHILLTLSERLLHPVVLSTDSSTLRSSQEHVVIELLRAQVLLEELLPLPIEDKIGALLHSTQHLLDLLIHIDYGRLLLALVLRQVVELHLVSFDCICFYIYSIEVGQVQRKLDNLSVALLILHKQVVQGFFLVELVQKSFEKTDVRRCELLEQELNDVNLFDEDLLLYLQL